MGSESIMAINDVSDAFGDWLETITGTRESGEYVSGRWVGDTPTDLSFVGVVQNANPKDLEVLQDGDETRESLKIHTTFELQATDRTNRTSGDLITYNGLNWRVYNIAYRVIGNYNKAILIRE